MGYRADGTSVLRSLEGEDVGYAMAFTAAAAQRIADALNKTSPEDGERAYIDPLTGERADPIDGRDDRPLSDVVKDGRYVKIVGPYATAQMNTPGGRQVRSLAAGSILPGDVTAGTARHLISVGLPQLVEAGSAVEAYEAAPTERQRVEMASPDVNRPTVGAPEPGSPAELYDRDPVAAAQAAATAGQPTIVQTSGAGLGLAGDEPTADSSAEGSAGARPRGNASRDVWAAYAAQQGASQDETRSEDEGGLSRDDLRTRYGS
jgi:hypothetical protein